MALIDEPMLRSVAVGVRALLLVAREQLGPDATPEAVAERAIQWRIAGSDDLERRPKLEDERAMTEASMKMVLEHMGGRRICICGKCPTEPAPPPSSPEIVH